MESLSKLKDKRKTIFTNTEEPCVAQEKHLFRKCPFTGPLKTS
jgi:hypothetical protein